MAGKGTIVSEAVLSALPLEVPPLELEIALVSWLAWAFALSALVLDSAPFAAVTAERAVTPDIALPGICVCCVPVALPAALLKNMRSSICGYCQYVGATSITT